MDAYPLDATTRPDNGGADMTCRFCDDGTGNSTFPYYGVAPHTHWFDKGEGGVVLASRPIIKPESEWPSNFVVDPENPRCGTYTHCLHCIEVQHD